MTSSSPWATRAAPIGPVGVGSVLWRSHGRLHLTIVVKARFALRDQEEALLVEPPALRLRDEHHGGDPTRSLCKAADVVPYRDEADVTLTGHAYAPPGRSLSVQVVRLGIYSGGEALLDKSVHVIGDRPNRRAAPTPFERMPLVWERAFGGIGYEDNPVGVGADERALVPNLVLPDDRERPAGFGPVSRYWWLRRRNVPTTLRKRVEAVVADVPKGFDWSYFQAAPADQRIRYLQGDEWLVLDGLHPELLRLQTRLPKVAGAARVLPLDPADEDLGDEVAMVADALAIDTDTQTCSVTWRGAIPVESEQDLDGMLVAGGLRLCGQGVDWLQAYQVEHVPSAPASPHGESVPQNWSDVTIVSESPELADEGGLPPSDLLARTTVDALPESGPAVPEPSHRRTIAEPHLGPPVTTIDRPRYPRSTPDTDETTDTGVQTIPGPDLDEVELTQPLPLVTDTEPGEPPPVADDDLPWVHEPAVEPPVVADPPRRPKVPVDPSALDECDLEEDEEPLTAIDLPLPGEPFPRRHRSEPPADHRSDSPPDAPRSAAPVRVPAGHDGSIASVPDHAPTLPVAVPFGDPARHRRPVPPARSPHPSLPPEPIDSRAFEATLRSAGASEADIAAMLAALDEEAAGGESED